MTRIVLTVTNDLVVDQRVHRISMSLQAMGFEVLLIGRRLKNSESVSRPYQVKRFRLLFHQSWLFYANYNLRLFLYLLFLKKYDVVVANDTDTLPAAQLAAGVRCKKLVYDAHEYFTEVPELLHKPGIKRIWGAFEKLLIPKADKAYTVCNSLARIYLDKYKVSFSVIRNLPLKVRSNETKLLKEKYPGRKIILYQGSINVGRGLERMIDTMPFINNTVFILIGSGDIIADLQKSVRKKELTDRVVFMGRIPFDSLPMYTRSADLGISLEEDVGLNYRYALPNKIFDYIQAEVPILVSDLPEMKSIVEKYQVGEVASERNPEVMASIIKEMLHNQAKRDRWKVNLKKAANELCWENEQEKLIQVYKDFL